MTLNPAGADQAHTRPARKKAVAECRINRCIDLNLPPYVLYGLNIDLVALFLNDCSTRVPRPSVRIVWGR
jgi:hypothetical protein